MSIAADGATTGAPALWLRQVSVHPMHGPVAITVGLDYAEDKRLGHIRRDYVLPREDREIMRPSTSVETEFAGAYPVLDSQQFERLAALGKELSPLETSCRGIFCVGDARAGSTKRVFAAVGEGSMAIKMVHERLRYLGAEAR